MGVGRGGPWQVGAPFQSFITRPVVCLPYRVTELSGTSSCGSR